jgi:hypothetical protein
MNNLGLPPLKDIVPPMTPEPAFKVHPLHPPPNISNTPPVIPVDDVEPADIIPTSDKKQSPHTTPKIRLPEIKVKPPTNNQKMILPLIEASIKIIKQAQIYGQIYNQLQQNYMQVANKYQDQLMQILPSIAMLTAKTPLSSITEDDLTQHIEQLYTMMPFQAALANTDKLVKGYYIAKINGINTKDLDTTDLMEVADNPAFAQSTNENLAQFLAQLGGIIQMKMQTALKQAGMVKDMYQEQLKQMQIHAQLMHYIATALTNMAKEEEMERHHRAEEELWRDRIGVERGRLQLREQYLNLLQQHYGDEASHWQNEDNYKVWKASQPKTKKSSSSSSSNTAGSNTSQSSSTIRPFP